jgi:hypothetical protein
MIRLALLGIPLALSASCSRHPVPNLSPFTSDGCSLFPDKDYQRGDSWCACCIEHDYAYWKGGTDAERLAADRALAECVRKSTGDSALAQLMYSGVRAGGSEVFPTWYRWGYGWPYGIKAIPDSVRKVEISKRSGTDRSELTRKICGE